MNFVKDFWKDEEGLETIEILLILSVLVVIAVMFKDKISQWANNLFNRIDNDILE
ncbi:Flp1 family type IVb pilin [Ornithinibacillus sp. 4-3]|uniref:Flp1 family type IVb pilin n=1 Tax=Ornithinibacillus sp. 4-3 TaxID=3231488 RepID=A0AB39HJG7_9BACI